MSDLIDRQAAIEAADDWDGGYNKERERFIRNALEELPSSQPVLTCKGCKYDGYYKHVQCRNCLRKERDLYEPE